MLVLQERREVIVSPLRGVLVVVFFSFVRVWVFQVLYVKHLHLVVSCVGCVLTVSLRLRIEVELVGAERIHGQKVQVGRALVFEVTDILDCLGQDPWRT